MASWPCALTRNTPVLIRAICPASIYPAPFCPALTDPTTPAKTALSRVNFLHHFHHSLDFSQHFPATFSSRVIIHIPRVSNISFIGMSFEKKQRRVRVSAGGEPKKRRRDGSARLAHGTENEITCPCSQLYHGPMTSRRKAVDLSARQCPSSRAKFFASLPPSLLRPTAHKEGTLARVKKKMSRN